MGLGGAIAADDLEQRRLQDLADAEVSALATLLEVQTTTRLQALERMASRQPQPEAPWRADAAHYVEHEPGLRAMEIINPDHRVRWVEPFAGNEAAIGSRLDVGDRRTEALRKARATPGAFVSDPMEFVEGGRGTLVLARFPDTGELQGFVLGIYSPAELTGISEFATDAYCLDLTRRDTSSLPPSRDCSDISASDQFAAGGQTWTLTLSATEAWAARHGSLLPTVLGALSLILAIILGVALDQAIRSERAAREAETLAAELAERTRDLEQTNQDLQQFAYAASHDLSEPVRMVLAFSTRLRNQLDERMSERERRHFEFLQEGAERMQRLLNALTRFSRVQRAEPQFVPTSLHDVVETVARGAQAHVAERGGHLSIDVEDVQVLADGLLLELALANLVNNALKYSEDAPVVRVHTQQEGGRVRVLVADEGIGIAPEYHVRIFRLFRRLHAANSTYSGSGIGLAVVHRIAQLHGSEVRVQSQSGEGSTFSFTLDRA